MMYNLLRLHPTGDPVDSRRILIAADRIRHTFLTGFTLPGCRMWYDNHIKDAMRLSANEYAGVYDSGTLIGYETTWHIAFTWHRILEMAGVKHTYATPDTSRPRDLDRLIKHTTNHFLGLLKSMDVAVQIRQYPSIENAMYVLDCHQYMQTFLRANARCWWLQAHWDAPERYFKQFLHIIAQCNQDQIARSDASIPADAKATICNHAFTSIRRNRPHELIEFFRQDKNPLDLTSPEFEHCLKAEARILKRENNARKTLRKRSTHRGRRALSKSKNRSSASRQKIHGLVYDFLNTTPL